MNDDARPVFWTDGNCRILGGEFGLGMEFGNWQLWCGNLPVIEGSFDVVSSYYLAEFFI